MHFNKLNNAALVDNQRATSCTYTTGTAAGTATLFTTNGGRFTLDLEFKCILLTASSILAPVQLLSLVLPVDLHQNYNVEE